MESAARKDPPELNKAERIGTQRFTCPKDPKIKGDHLFGFGQVSRTKSWPRITRGSLCQAQSKCTGECISFTQRLGLQILGAMHGPLPVPIFGAVCVRLQRQLGQLVPQRTCKAGPQGAATPGGNRKSHQQKLSREWTSIGLGRPIGFAHGFFLAKGNGFPLGNRSEHWPVLKRISQIPIWVAHCLIAKMG